jgi:hypothetical protein|tara:strand:- start:1163 stop:1951 length:789 start_codon:yes stop_codon:yes gene_type:complete
MRGFYWGTGGVRCGFCNQTGHNITTCKVVNRVVTGYFGRIEAGDESPASPVEIKALKEIKNREDRKANKLFKTKRAKPKCSYCGLHGHKRPKCEQFKEFKEMAHQANRKWKKTFVSSINEHGLGVGALVKINPEMHYIGSTTTDSIGMIIEYDQRNTNVFCGMGRFGDYQSESSFKVLVAEKVYNISLCSLADLLGKQLIKKTYWTTKTPTVINKSTWEPSSEWIDSECDEIMEWFFNDVNLKKAIDGGVFKYLKEWSKVFC